MSKLNIMDLEKIKNGELVRYNFGYKRDYSKEITLRMLNFQLQDLKYIRDYILDTFKSDVRNEFDRLKGDRIEELKDIEFDKEKLFLSKALCLKVPTDFGYTTCLVSKNGIEDASLDTSELRKKIKLIYPYIQGILALNEQSNVLDNLFYDELSICDENLERQLVANGNGIFLPFKDYDNSDEKQDLLWYYYHNKNRILHNILVPDEEILEKYRTNVSLPKAMAIYKGNKCK